MSMPPLNKPTQRGDVITTVRIESDGSAEGTKLYDEDGQLMDVGEVEISIKVKTKEGVEAVITRIEAEAHLVKT